jgi:hypothetical protein
MTATKFSDYLGLKHYKKAKKLKHFIHLRLAQGPQSSNTYHTISPTVNSGPLTKKVCFSDVMHYQISIFVIKMMVKIGVIFMPFSNPMCHFRDTADFTRLQSLGG